MRIMVATKHIYFNYALRDWGDNREKGPWTLWFLCEMDTGQESIRQ